MDRTELTVAVAATLVGAVLLGWVLAWIAGRLNARGPGDPSETRNLVELLRASEAREADLGARLFEAEAELAAALDRLDRERARSEKAGAAHREEAQRREA